ncbi:MAG: Flp family type IVb pilin [Gammaproteobacteria bacterium]|nr:Flp family type IVb pilin [Gammaproteobacteria bacterium]
MSVLNKFLKNEDGATAIEYALIAAGIAIVIIAAVGTLGGNIAGTFAEVACAVSGGTFDAAAGTCS